MSAILKILYLTRLFCQEILMKYKTEMFECKQLDATVISNETLSVCTFILSNVRPELKFEVLRLLLLLSTLKK